MSLIADEQGTATALPRSGMLIRGTRLLVSGLELSAAALLCMEFLLLLTGVLARYFFRVPLVWVDELATSVFIWLTMFGVVLAVDRSEHMRLTAFVAALPPRWRARLEAAGIMLIGVIVCLLLPSAHDFAEDQAFVTTPILHFSDKWRVISIEIGFSLVLCVVVLKMATEHAVRDLIGAASVIAVIAAVLWGLSPKMSTLGNYNLILFFGGGVGFCVLVGVPIAFAFGASTAAYLLFVQDLPLTVIIGRLDEGVSNVILLSVPLFIVLGMLLEVTGMARAMIDFLGTVLGRVRGGLSFVMLAAIYLVSGISGSKAADMAAVAPVLLPEMRRRGSDEGEMVALMAASAAMSETIPPSLVLITLGSVSGVSIAALFSGGLLPALVLAIALGVLAYFRSAKEVGTGGEDTMKMSRIARAFGTAFPALLLPFLIRAAVIEGVATATEVSTLGIAYAVLVGALFYRNARWSRVYQMLVETASLSGAILLIIGMATAMGWALTQSGFSGQLVSAMSGVPGGRIGFLLISMVVFIVLGSVLEGIPAIVLFAPLLFPAARTLGINEVHYAMVVVLAMGIGLFAPPVGVGFYGACAIGKVDPARVMPKTWAYIFVLIFGLILVAAVPWFSVALL
jgi:tripartite ATP-independent transporter DctM subunit